MKITITITTAPVALAAALLAAACTPKAPEASLTGQVKAVVERSKTPRHAYAVYTWNTIAIEGAPPAEWGAEFHSGALHRVETPRDRLVADCEALTGFGLNLASGKVVKGPSVARAACGISTNKAFVSSAWQGTVQTPFGQADRIRLVDHDNVRTYDVTADGVIVRGTYAEPTPGEPLSLTSQAVAVLPDLPAEDMFTQASLARSYVPDRFKAAPAP